LYLKYGLQVSITIRTKKDKVVDNLRNRDSCMTDNHLKQKKKERVRKDSTRVEGKRKLWGRRETFYFLGEKKHLFVRRFPRNTRSYF
jgi:hypothetical protein